MPGLSGRSSDLLQDALRDYLAQHPEAADGLAGIRLWWLPEPLREVPIEELHHVLDRLVEHGEMRRTEMLDGTELYAGNTTHAG